MNTLVKARLIKNDLNRKNYVDLGHKFLSKLIVPVTAFTRHLCILQGKNPDYVAPPQPAPAIFESPPSIATRGVMVVNYIPAWVKKSFKDKSEHVINKIKFENLEKRSNIQPLQVVAPDVTYFPKAQKNINAIDELRKELEKVNLCPSSTISPVILSTSKVIEKKVTKDLNKDFGGSFRRSGK